MKSDRWVLLVIVLIVAGMGLGFYCLFNWADEQSPWILRVVLVLLATSIGFRIGREIQKSRKGPKWLPPALAVVSLLLAGWFGMVQPGLRDQAIAEFIAEGRATTEAIEAVAAETQAAADANEPMIWQLRERNVEVLRRALDWLERYKVEADRYSGPKLAELVREAQRMIEASASARETLARWAAGPKKE
jgi:hypothetical protein